jgi:hypothetical protein
MPLFGRVRTFDGSPPEASGKLWLAGSDDQFPLGPRPFVFCFGDDVCCEIEAHLKDPALLMRRLGYGPGEGGRFAVVIWEEEEGAACEATWDGVADFVRSHFSARTADLVASFVPLFKEKPFEHWEAELGRELKNPGKEQFDEAALLALPSPRGSDVRLFLFSCLKLLGGFSGSGLTVPDPPGPGVLPLREFLAVNKRWSNPKVKRIERFEIIGARV